MARMIDNEDYAGILARMTQSSAVADRDVNINREDFDHVADQLLGGETLTRRTKIDIADLATVIQEVDAAAEE